MVKKNAIAAVALLGLLGWMSNGVQAAVDTNVVVNITVQVVTVALGWEVAGTPDITAGNEGDDVTWALSTVLLSSVHNTNTTDTENMKLMNYGADQLDVTSVVTITPTQGWLHSATAIATNQFRLRFATNGGGSPTFENHTAGGGGVIILGAAGPGAGDELASGATSDLDLEITIPSAVNVASDVASPVGADTNAKAALTITLTITGAPDL